MLCIGQREPTSDRKSGGKHINIGYDIKVWPEKNVLCLRVSIADTVDRGVTRRLDNNMINGSELLCAFKGATPMYPEALLNLELVKDIVRPQFLGYFHGVWIPLERALRDAHRFGIIELLYPLFLVDLAKVAKPDTESTMENMGLTSSGLGSVLTADVVPAEATTSQANYDDIVSVISLTEDLRSSSLNDIEQVSEPEAPPQPCSRSRKPRNPGSPTSAERPSTTSAAPSNNGTTRHLPETISSAEPNSTKSDCAAPTVRYFLESSPLSLILQANIHSRMMREPSMRRHRTQDSI
jgi:hypothetical protein